MMTNDPERIALYRENLATFGEDIMPMKCVEEMAELIQAICKHDLPNIMEEIADVYITLDQLCLVFCADVEPVIQRKLERQRRRINEAKRKDSQ